MHEQTHPSTHGALHQPPTAYSHGRGSACSAVVGLQWGDEGKGKVVDLIAEDFDAVVRYNGGANAGHSVVVKGERYALHLVPSGILWPGKLSVIGNGVAVDPEVLVREMEGLSRRGVDVSGLVVSDRAHVVMPYHKGEDELRERLLSASGNVTQGGESIGTTKRGIGPCYADKAQRATAVRVGDLLRPDALRGKLRRICAFKNTALGALGWETRYDADRLTDWAADLGRTIAPSIKDTTYLLHDLISPAGGNKRLLFEGANAALLDVDHGTHPYVTSSSTTVLGIPSGTGIPGSRIGSVIGVCKAYSTRVGNGPLTTELHDELGQRIRERGREYGTTTGRPRRVGWLDLVAVRYSAMLNGVTSLAVMLLDVLSGIDELRVCRAYRLRGGEGGVTDRFPPDAEMLMTAEPVYEVLEGFGEDLSAARSIEQLPRAARAYVQLIEQVVGVRVSVISVGPGREQTIVCGAW